jgi:Arc/MetJ-type ribon-helix-helix transcriptional regulator
VFVHESARDAIDRLIAKGRFKTRREAMEHAIHSLFRAEESATTPR